MSDWRESYLEGCRPSEVPWDAYPEERPTMGERLGEFHDLRRKCSGCGAEVLADGACPLCGTALAA